MPDPRRRTRRSSPPGDTKLLLRELRRELVELRDMLRKTRQKHPASNSARGLTGAARSL